MAQSEKKVVEANEFVLKDEQGRVRARIGLTDNNQPAINLLDEAGQSRLTVSFNGDQSSSVTLRDEDGNARADLRTIRGLAGLILSRATGEQSVVLTSSDNGLAALAISDQTDVIRSVLAVTQDGRPLFHLNEGQQNAQNEDSESENI